MEGVDYICSKSEALKYLQRTLRGDYNDQVFGWPRALPENVQQYFNYF